MLTEREKFIFESLATELENSENEIVTYMNENFSQEQRELHGTNIYNMLVHKSVVSMIQMQMLGEN